MSSAGANLTQQTAPEAWQRDASATARRPRISWRRVVRPACEAAVLAAVALLVLTAWLVDRYRVDSNSMAEMLLGPHATIECSHCGFPFDVGVDGPDSWQRPVNCANCGAVAGFLLPEQPQAGDTVVIDRSAPWCFQPCRWQLMAFRSPTKANEVLVKRIVGLPGESIEIKGGDIYVDGQIVRKSLAQQRATAQPVHDDRFWKRGTARCWQYRDSGQWLAAAELSGYRQSTPQPSVLDWLTYHHRRRDGAGEEITESVVTDVYGYNQTHPVGDVHPVRDLILTCNVAAGGAGTLYIKASDGAHDFLCSIPTDGELVCTAGGVTVARRDDVALRLGRQQTLEVSLVDRALVLAVDGQIVVDYPFERPDAAPTTATPFALAADGLMTVKDLRIDRDVYYGPVIQPGESPAIGSPLVLGEDEYFVLSDNCPLGHDSRYHDFGPTVPAKLFIGKPLLGFGQSQRKLNRPPPIQVPGLSRIRYIR